MAEKQELYADLYAIKAGLAIMAAEAEKLADMEGRVKAAERKIAENGNLCQGANASVDGTQGRIDEARRNIRGFWGGFLVKVLVILGVLAIAAFFLYRAFLEFLNADAGGPDAMGVVFIVIASILIVSTISIGKKMGPFFDELDMYTQNKHKARKALKDANKSRAKIEAQLPALEKERQEAQAYLQSHSGECLSIVQSTYDVLLKNHTQYIKPCDFGNVDLILYFLGTGRANDLQTALEKVDQEIRFGTLVGTLERCKQEICCTLREGFRDLQTTLSLKLDDLGKQISYQHEQTMAGMAKLHGAMSEANAQRARQINGQELQNSLLDKLNTNSQKLVKDTEELLRR